MIEVERRDIPSAAHLYTRLEPITRHIPTNIYIVLQTLTTSACVTRKHE